MAHEFQEARGMMKAQVRHQGVLADGRAAQLRSRTGIAWSVLAGWWSSLLAGISLYLLLYCPSSSSLFLSTLCSSLLLERDSSAALF